ncbi:hypothetical protein CYLTODRAFT_425611 [Cylindrobasidium torrendii FP15055 ss-10]|uniref:Chromo domain-containing protein n=1 Tax=Cylindrobasidium torrendii FP15055 ss-10 TaxID=1314674 RepID=A0A0D7B1B6_9AGAR|nr:hypothetical protein CYLTODRAFT_425611 [Cylindrobasidium torrendii FP15055 ss-10]
MPRPKKDEPEDEPMGSASQDEDETDGEEEQKDYPVEKIYGRRQKKGARPGVWEYHVRWEGFPPDEDTWEPKENLTGSEDLMRKLDEEMDAKIAEKKAASANKSAKRSRQSDVREAETPTSKKARSASTNGKTYSKRSKSRQSSPERQDDEDEDEDEDMDKPKTNDSASATSTEPAKIVSMPEKYKKLPSWENFISKVETVESEVDGELYVFFTTKDGDNVREPCSLCRKKFPNKLFDFYEKHLKWHNHDTVDA